MSETEPLGTAVGITGTDELIRNLSAHGVHSVLTQFTDIHGVAKGKLVPLERLQELIVMGAGFAGPSIWGTGLPRRGARSEYYARVVASSLRPLPFMPGVAHAVCDGFAGGEPLATCSRQLLKRQLGILARRGWTLWVGVEPEFFLLRRDEQGLWRAGDPGDQLSKPSYDLKSIHHNRAFVEDMRRNLLALGFQLEQFDHEDANGQYEINYRFDEALAAADRYMLFKMCAHAVAAEHGWTFSCMPKPLAHAPGSGLHFHLSLTDAQGRQVMAPTAGASGLSQQGGQFVSGLLEHADALAALCAPTVNSYKRLAIGASLSGTTWSPVWKAHGDNNRTCLIRTVGGRIEWRLPDPACNIYAAIAATLAAGLHGIDAGLPEMAACDVDLYEQAARGESMPPRLPRDLRQALDALQQDAELRQRLGDDFCGEFLRIKGAEWDDFAGQVHAWEMHRYADGH